MPLSQFPLDARYPRRNTRRVSCILTIGNFDGVHLGHRALLRASADAPEKGPVRALFFDPHPSDYFGRRTGPLLTSPRRRKQLLLRSGADEVHVQTFDASFAALTPEDFVTQVVVKEQQARVVVVGSDFRFGAGAAGNTDTLQELGKKHGDRVVVVDAVNDAEEPISSTRIRTALQAADTATATRLLGRAHDVEAEVVLGHQRGRTIGFPTANLGAQEGLLPADGVYAVVARVGEKLVRGMANIGTRPTFEAGRSTEVHLFDFHKDIYGEVIRVAFVHHLRGERRFSGVDELVAQLQADRTVSVQALAQADENTWGWI
ncbi:MAG: bifunctional riboflavin kinase/FAD synthetase [Polyangiales bacterium]